MVNLSRGCTTCKRRRIKCDEQRPECTQCQELGESCPGALEGPIFVDESQKMKRRHELALARNRCRSQSSKRHHKNDKPHRQTKAPGETRNFSSSRSSQPKSPPTPAALNNSPSDHDNTTDQQVSTPIDPKELIRHLNSSLNCRPGGPMLQRWLEYLPDLVLQESLPALTYAICASSLALDSGLSGDFAMREEATRWYLKSLESVQEHVTPLSSHDNVSDGAICVPLLLSLYEMVSSTYPDAWMDHICAAARFVELRGPRNFNSELSHQIFCTVRLAMVYVSTTRRQPSFLSSELWLSEPFLIYPKTLFDDLVDCLLIISKPLSQLDNNKNNIRSSDPRMHTTPSSSSESVYFQLHDIKDKLHFWKSTYEASIQHTCHQILSTPCSNQSTSLPTFTTNSSPRPPSHSATENHIYSDPFLAENITLYDTGCILVTHALLQFLQSHHQQQQQQQQQCLLHAQITAHCKSILDATTCIESRNGWKNPGGPFRLIYPLRVVAATSSWPKQKQQALDTLTFWGQTWALKGICST